MKIVIDIPKEMYKSALSGYLCGSETLVNAIKNGTPLPEGHKVIDAWALQEHLALVPMEDRTYREAVEIIDRFPVITEADRSGAYD